MESYRTNKKGGMPDKRAGQTTRKVNPEDILLPEGYRIEVFAVGLSTPINMMFTDDGQILVADAGVISGNGKVLRLTSSGVETLGEGFIPPLTGINYCDGNIYVSHRGRITIIKPDGSKEDILEGLPSWGDHHNNRVVFGPDGKMYFGQGTATNSGVVGEDNDWVRDYPFFHDYPGRDIALVGQNFHTPNMLTKSNCDIACTGAYSPFGIPTRANEITKGITAASGSILRANPDGSCLEQVAWGLRNPFRIMFDRYNRLLAANHGSDVRGSRPIKNSPDEFQLIIPGTWYGWPDYTGGMPVTLPLFKAEGKPQPTFLLTSHPMKPPIPIVNFTPHAAIMGFDINYNPEFGRIGEVYIAEFGPEAPETTGGDLLLNVGHRISVIDMNRRNIRTFAMNKSGYAASITGGGGFQLPIDAVFGPDGSLYVVDFGLNVAGETDEWIPETGVVWKISR